MGYWKYTIRWFLIYAIIVIIDGFLSKLFEVEAYSYTFSVVVALGITLCLGIEDIIKEIRKQK